jgi:hypothetical protein
MQSGFWRRSLFARRHRTENRKTTKWSSPFWTTMISHLVQRNPRAKAVTRGRTKFSATATLHYEPAHLVQKPSRIGAEGLDQFAVPDRHYQIRGESGAGSDPEPFEP